MCKTGPKILMTVCDTMPLQQDLGKEKKNKHDKVENAVLAKDFPVPKEP